MKSPLNDEQARETADALHGTSQNIYQIAGMFLGRKVETEEIEAVYDHVAEVGEVFKCEECNLWQSKTEAVSYRENFCQSCDDEESEDEG